MSGRLHGYARVSAASDADANNLETRRRVLADCEQVFEGGAGPPGPVADRGTGTAGVNRDTSVSRAEWQAGPAQTGMDLKHQLNVREFLSRPR